MRGLCRYLVIKVGSFCLMMVGWCQSKDPWKNNHIYQNYAHRKRGYINRSSNDVHSSGMISISHQEITGKNPSTMRMGFMVWQGIKRRKNG